MTARRRRHALGRGKGVVAVATQRDLDWIADVVDVAGTEEEAVAALEGCLVRLRAVRDAQQQALQALSPAEVRAAADGPAPSADRGHTMSPAQARAAVSVAELQRAWAAVQTGAFRPAGTPGASRLAPAPNVVQTADTADADSPAVASGGVGTSVGWVPGPGEEVIAMVGAVGSCGASTLAVALATADGRPGRVVECASASASGLVTAVTAELGEQAGWLRGRRDQIVVERCAEILAGPEGLAMPLPVAEGTVRTVVDVSWEIGQLVGAGASCWLGDYLTGASTVVVATVATVTGIRRLDAVLDLLGTDRVVAAVLGPPLKRWDTALCFWPRAATGRVAGGGPRRPGPAVPASGPGRSGRDAAAAGAGARGRRRARGGRGDRPDPGHGGRASMIGVWGAEAVVAARICPVAPGNAATYINQISGYVLFGVLSLFAVSVVTGLGAIVAGRMFGMAHASKIGVVSLAVIFMCAIGYVVLPAMVAAIVGTGCIG